MTVDIKWQEEEIINDNKLESSEYIKRTYSDRRISNRIYLCSRKYSTVLSTTVDNQTS